jgi:hypothetical protein
MPCGNERILFLVKFLVKIESLKSGDFGHFC